METDLSAWKLTYWVGLLGRGVIGGSPDCNQRRINHPYSRLSPHLNSYVPVKRTCLNAYACSVPYPIAVNSSA